jgi:hypothetical protein
MIPALRIACLALAMTVVGARAGAAQSGCPAADPQEEIYIEMIARTFTSPDYSSTREILGVDTLATGATKELITDAALCDALFAAALEATPRVLKLPAAMSASDARASQEFRYYQIGAYYAVMMIPKPPDGMILNGWAILMIFRRDPLRYVGSRLI